MAVFIYNPILFLIIYLERRKCLFVMTAASNYVYVFVINTINQAVFLGYASAPKTGEAVSKGFRFP